MSTLYCPKKPGLVFGGVFSRERPVHRPADSHSTIQITPSLRGAGFLSQPARIAASETQQIPDSIVNVFIRLKMPTSFCPTAVGARRKQLVLFLLLLLVLLFQFLIRLRSCAKIGTTGTVQQHEAQQHYNQVIAHWLGLYTYVQPGNALIVIMQRALHRLKGTDKACKPFHAYGLCTSAPLRQHQKRLRLA